MKEIIALESCNDCMAQNTHSAALFFFYSNRYEAYSSFLSVDDIKADIPYVGHGVTETLTTFLRFGGLCQLLGHEQSKTATALS